MTCQEGADAFAQFDVALMRPAQQGFFDVAVSFNSIFCSAKFDCCYDRDQSDSCDPTGTEDIRLLFDAAGARARTFVLGFACTAGTDASVATELYLDALQLDCDVTSDASTFLADLTLDPAHGAPGNQCTAGALTGCPALGAAATVDPNDFLYQFAVYTGEEALTTGGAPANKLYWNVALGVKPAISACRLRTSGTADDAANAADSVVAGQIAPGAVYPYVLWDVPLGSCAAEPLRFATPGAPVTTAYTGTGTAGRSFSYRLAAGAPASPFCTPACHHGGRCTAGGCDCTGTGFTGTTCETPQCPAGYAPAGPLCAPLLLSLAPSAGTLSPAFDPATLAYALEVDPTTATLTLTATVAAPVALTIAGAVTPSGTPSAPIPLAVGPNPLTLTATDGPTTTYTLTVTRLADTTAPAAPVILSPAATPTTTATDTLTLSGTCEPGATLTPSGADAATLPCPDGTFSALLSHATDGTYAVALTQTDAAGNTSTAASFTWVRDSAPPAAPTLTAPAGATATTAGSSLTLAGTCTDGLTVTLAGDSAHSAPCAAGAFAFEVTATADGLYTYALRQVRPDTLVASSTVAATWTRDTAPPAAPTLTAPTSTPHYSAGSDLTLAGTCEPGATVTLSGDASDTALCTAGTFSFPLTRTTNGTYAFALAQTDLAGNTSSATPVTWVRDDTVPAAPTLTTPAASPADTSGSTLTLAGTCTDGFVVYLQGASTQSTTCAAGAFSFDLTAATDGQYVYALYQESPFTLLTSETSSFTWRRDATAPDEVTVATPPSNPYFSGDDTLVISGACETGATVSIGGAEMASVLCADSTYSFSVTRLVNTTYNFNLVQTDRAGNASLSLLFQWVRDNTIPPTPVITNPAASPVHNAASSFTLAGTCLTDYEVHLSGDATASQTCAAGAFSFALSAATDGSRTYEVHQTNPLTFLASSATSATWVRDTVAPAALVLTAPATNPYASGDATFALTGLCEPGATVTLAGAQTGSTTCLPAGTFRFDLAKSQNGTYDYTLLQRDAALNASGTLAFRWIRDTSIPPTPVLSSPTSSPFTSNGSSLTLAGSCTGANTVFVTGSDSASATCAAGAFSFTFTKLADGTYGYSVVQQSAVNGSFSAAAEQTWVRDTVAPAAPVLASLTPLSPAANANPKAKGTASADTVSVQLFKAAACGGAVAATGTRANFVGTGVAVPATLQATMTVSARAVDSARNTSPCSAASLGYQHRAAELVLDLNTLGSGASSPVNFGAVGTKVFFRATDGLTGNELFASDGTAAGTYRVKDINPADSSNPLNIVDFNGVALFAADDGETGVELWRSDGTDAGTVRVADLNPGPFSSTPANFLVVGSVAYFTADDGESGVELWKTDGTDAGTLMVADLEPGAVGSGPTLARSVGGVVVFRATTTAHGNELFKTDGTAAGTTCFDLNPGIDGATGLPLSSTPAYLVNMGSYVYFRAAEASTGSELYRTDGTSVTRLTDLYAGSTSSSPAYLAVAGSTLFFYARQYAPSAVPPLASTGYELFKYTEAGGVVLVKDIVSGGTSSSPAYLVPIGPDKVVFRATVAATGSEPWVSDGTTAGTFALADVNPGAAASGMSTPVALGGKAYFAGTTNGEVELWETDGTVAGTFVHDLNPGTQSSSPSSLAPFGSKIVLSVHTLTYAREPWFIDASGPELLADLNLIPSGTPSGFVQYGSLFLFAAEDGANGRELWRSDSTAAGTAMVKDINPDPGAHSSPASLTLHGGYVYFRADDGTHGFELWRTDGTEAGTLLVADIAPDEVPSTPNYLVSFGSQLLFSADDGTNGIELWELTGAGPPTLVKNIHTTAATSSSPLYLTVMGPKVYFRATSSTYGAELWSTDGTNAGTTLVKNIYGGTSNASPASLTVVGGNKLFFSAAASGTGTELYVTDGTSAGTVLIGDLNPGSASSSPSNLRELNGALIFSAIHPTLGRELFTSSGVAGDATLVKDLRPGLASSSPGGALILGGRAYFSASDDDAGAELWETDGTSAGTMRVLDGRAGAAGSSPTNLLALDATSFIFAANDGVNGTEPWRSDRTAAGTYLIQDINLFGPGWGGAWTVMDGVLYFSASDGVGGYELWKY